MKPGTSECLQYDTRYQAITLDEAIGSFVDLTLEDDDKPPEREKTEADELCQTPECKACRKRLKQRLKKVGLLNEFIAPDVAAAQMGEEAEMCNKYRFSRKDAEKYEYWKVKGKKIKSGEDSDSNSDSNEDEDAKHSRHFLKQFPFYGSKHRFIRQAQTAQNNANSGVVGTADPHTKRQDHLN
ncbi:Protein T16H12.9 [Aphelenchoides avenae]|nr:Protein T16H12.9 [Aphelenchus avenae]